MVIAVAVAGLLPDAAREIDERVGDALRSNDFRVLDHANHVLDIAGSPLVLVFAVGAAVRLAWYRWRAAVTAAFPAASVGLAGILADHVLKPATQSTWPSGTTAVMTSLGASAALLLAAHGRAVPVAAIALSTAVVAAVAVALLLTGYHTLSDIGGGVILGLCSSFGCAIVHDVARRDR